MDSTVVQIVQDFVHQMMFFKKSKRFRQIM